MLHLALVMTATAMALSVAIPVGILAGFNPRLNGALQPLLDMIQTLPPYIYLLPAVALMGFGPATALAATMVAAPPRSRAPCAGRTGSTRAASHSFALSSGNFPSTLTLSLRQTANTS